MGLWRCLQPECQTGQHGHDFVSDEPVCPLCGIDGRTPEGGSVIAKLEPVHLLVKDKQGPIVGRGARYRVLCDPSLKLGPKVRATGEPMATYCPACKAHADFPKGVDDMVGEVPAWKVGKEIKAIGG